MYVEPRKMIQMNWFAGQKLRHRCREQTYGHQGGKTAVGWGWWCAELGDWDWHVYNDVYKIDDWLKKKSLLGTFLVVQWLGICLPMQGTQIRALVGEDPTCRGASKPVRHNYWTCALEPASHNYWAHVPQLLKPERQEPMLHNKRSHRNEKPANHNEE